MTAPTVPAPTTRDLPRPVGRRNHPASEYWDVFSATWRSRGSVVPLPRAGD